MTPLIRYCSADSCPGTSIPRYLWPGNRERCDTCLAREKTYAMERARQEGLRSWLTR